jgi:hypothetical protein
VYSCGGFFTPGGGDKYFLRLGFEEGASTADTDADISQAKHLQNIGWQFLKSLEMKYKNGNNSIALWLCATPEL